MTNSTVHIDLETFFADVEERAQHAQELAETERSMAFLRGVVVGCFSTLFTVSFVWLIWRIW